MIALRIELDTTGYADNDRVTVELNGKSLIRQEPMPESELVLDTDPLYFGSHTITAWTFDAIGNSQSGDPSQEVIFLNTGPRPPENPRFYSQDGDGPVSIAFEPSPEL